MGIIAANPSEPLRHAADAGAVTKGAFSRLKEFLVTPLNVGYSGEGRWGEAGDQGDGDSLRRVTGRNGSGRAYFRGTIRAHRARCASRISRLSEL